MRNEIFLDGVHEYSFTKEEAGDTIIYKLFYPKMIFGTKVLKVN
jgi:hypothetical protein